ncbi:MAG: hypothetical protein ACEQSB_07810, partial [Undibacterium sp.]
QNLKWEYEESNVLIVSQNFSRRIYKTNTIIGMIFAVIIIAIVGMICLISGVEIAAVIMATVLYSVIFVLIFLYFVSLHDNCLSARIRRWMQ